MKRIPKRLIILAFVIAAIYLVLNIVISAFGKRIIISQVEKNLKCKARLSSLNFSFPFSIGLTNFEIESFFKADYIVARPSILGFLSGRMILNDLKIIRPLITLERAQTGALNFSLPQTSGKPQFLLAGLRLNEGRLIFIDKKAGPEGIKIILNDININISKAAFPPMSLLVNFKASAFLVDDQNVNKGQFLASGWVDFRPKDMDGKIELKDMDAIYLSPYYANMIPTKKLLSAKLNFTSDLKAKNNDLIAKCHLEFSDIIYEKPPKPEEGKEKGLDLLPNILDIFSSDTGNIVFDFAINTKLDSPRLDFINLKGAIAQSAVRNIVNQPPEKTVEKVKDVVNELKDFGKELKDIFKKKD